MNAELLKMIEQSKQEAIAHVRDAFDELATAVSEASGQAPSEPSIGEAQPLPVPGIAKWLGSWNADIWTDVRQRVVASWPERPPLFVLYNIPNRDNGGYSAGGLTSVQAYWDWVGKIANAAAIKPCWFIVEPDALGHLGEMSPEAQQLRIEALQGSVAALIDSNLESHVFLDASMWVEAEEMARRLRLVSSSVDGFSVNVSNYYDTETVTRWADGVSKLSGLNYIVDTSRNGRGNPHAPAWCNVTDTMVGARPTLETGNRNCLAYVWAKVPGESDGKQINGDGTDRSSDRNDVPDAGQLWPEAREALYSGNWDDFKRKYQV